MRVLLPVATAAALAAGLVAVKGDALRSGGRLWALEVVDGDTVHSTDARFRLRGIDAAEIHHAQCEAERRLGQLTKRRLEALLQSGPASIYPEPNDPASKLDKHERWLVDLFVNGEDVGCVLMREGYVRPWRGRREDWCVKTEYRKADPQVDCSTTSSTN